ncbi:MAG: MBL fold metallo-hydrolase [Clostridia bacterium]|nr:MBL fold metallo-hydrolase [Clostridia bacterium]
MILKRIKFQLGDISDANCYIIQDEDTKETMIIDPGADAKEIEDMLNTIEAKLKYIVLTHCHADHISGTQAIKEKFGGQILIHIKDEEGLHNRDINLSEYIGAEIVTFHADARLNDEDLIHLGENEFKIIHTPGHTHGGICIYCEKEKMLFSGDTMFRGSWGRTDLPTGNFVDIINSITDKLMKLPKETIVYPGHGKSTRIGDEEPIYLELKPKKN